MRRPRGHGTGATARPGPARQAGGRPAGEASSRSRTRSLKTTTRAGRPALHLDRTADGSDRAREGDHQAVADGLDHAAAMRGYGAPQHGEVLAPHDIRRLVSPTIEQRRRTDEVGEKDRHEALLHAKRDDRRSPNPCHPSLGRRSGGNPRSVRGHPVAESAKDDDRRHHGIKRILHSPLDDQPGTELGELRQRLPGFSPIPTAGSRSPLLWRSTIWMPIARRGPQSPGRASQGKVGEIAGVLAIRFAREQPLLQAFPTRR